MAQAPIEPEALTPPSAETEEHHEREHRGVFSAIRVVAGVTLISRFGGLFRDGALTRILGSGPISSAFNFAFMIPNVFRRLFGEGALTAAFIPEYATLARDDPERASRFASLTLVIAAAVTVAVTLLLEAALMLALWLAPPSPERRLVLELTMLLVPYMPLVCMAALLAGMLQTHGRFGLATAGPIVLNAAMLTGALVAYLALDMTPTQTAYFVSGAVTLSGIVLAGWLGWALRRHAAWTVDFRGVGAETRRMLKRFVPAAIGLGALQLSSVIDGLIATYPMLVGTTFMGLDYPLDDATNGILQYTQRLYQFPLGVFGIAVATAVFPALSRATDNPTLFADMLRRGLRLSLFISLPASLGLALVGEDVARLVFRGENFSEEGVRRSAAILLGYAISVWAFSANQVLTRAFYARGDVMTPVRISLQCVAINLVGNLTLIWVPGIGETAFGWSAAMAYTAQYVLMIRKARELMPDGRLLDAETMKWGGASLEHAFLMGLAVIVLLEFLPEAATMWMTAVRLAVCCGVGAGVYFLLARRVRMPEYSWLMSRRVP